MKIAVFIVSLFNILIAILLLNSLCYDTVPSVFDPPPPLDVFQYWYMEYDLRPAVV